MTQENKSKLEQIINKIKTKETKLYYCSLAEIQEKNFLKATTLANAMQAGKDGKVRKMDRPDQQEQELHGVFAYLHCTAGRAG